MQTAAKVGQEAAFDPVTRRLFRFLHRLCDCGDASEFAVRFLALCMRLHFSFLTVACKEGKVQNQNRKLPQGLLHHAGVGELPKKTAHPFSSAEKATVCFCIMNEGVFFRRRPSPRFSLPCEDTRRTILKKQRIVLCVVSFAYTLFLILPHCLLYSI